MDSIVLPEVDDKKILKKTVGAHSSELKTKDAPTHDPIELEREMHKDYEANIYECIENAKKEFFKDFYVVVTTKKERLLDNVIRNYFFARNSCPTPEWDQTVYKYTRDGEKVDFLWVVPSKDTCELFKSNIAQIAPQERGLLQFVLDFENGTLLRKSRSLNGEDMQEEWKSSLIFKN